MMINVCDLTVSFLLHSMRVELRGTRLEMTVEDGVDVMCHS